MPMARVGGGGKRVLLLVMLTEQLVGPKKQKKKGASRTDCSSKGRNSKFNCLHFCRRMQGAPAGQRRERFRSEKPGEINLAINGTCKKRGFVSPVPLHFATSPVAYSNTTAMELTPHR